MALFNLIQYASDARIEKYVQECVAPNTRHYPKWILTCNETKAQQERAKLEALYKKNGSVTTPQKRKYLMLIGRLFSLGLSGTSRLLAGFMVDEMSVHHDFGGTSDAEKARLKLCARYAVVGYYVLKGGKVDTNK